MTVIVSVRMVKSGLVSQRVASGPSALCLDCLTRRWGGKLGVPVFYNVLFLKQKVSGEHRVLKVQGLECFLLLFPF